MAATTYTFKNANIFDYTRIHDMSVSDSEYLQILESVEIQYDLSTKNKVNAKQFCLICQAFERNFMILVPETVKHQNNEK